MIPQAKLNSMATADRRQLTNSKEKMISPDGKPLRVEPKETREPRMLEAAKSFENQFIRQMIGEMRKTVPKDDLLGEGMADGIYRDQLDNEYADTWTKQGG